jgi:hypothetical protein
MMMSLKQHVHDYKPESLLGKSCEDGTGNEVYILGERLQTDIPDNIDTEKIKRIKMVFIIFLVNLQIIMTIMIFLVQKFSKKILIQMRIVKRQGPKDVRMKTPMAFAGQYSAFQISSLKFLCGPIAVGPLTFSALQTLTVGTYLGRPTPSFNQTT